MVLADAPAPVRTPPAASLRRSGPAEPSESTRSWLRLGLYVVGFLLGAASLRVALEGVGWWFVMAVAALLPALAIAIVARLGRRGWQRPLAGILAALAVLTLGFARDTALLGVIPTPETVRRWIELANEGGRSISAQRIPATAEDGILFLLAILAVVSIVVIAPALDRAPAIAALPFLVVLSIPVAIRAGVAEPAWFVLVAVAYLALLRVGRRRMALRTVLAAGAVVILGALLLPNLFPPLREYQRATGTGIGTGLNPLINLGQDLRREDVVTALTYTTDAPGGVYLRLATLDEFTGVSWEPDVTIDPNNDIAAFPAPQGLGSDVPRAPYSASISIQDVSGRWLPLPYPTTSVEGLDGTWNWEPDGLAVRSTGADARGQQYDVTFLDVEPDLGQLTADLEPDVSDRYLRLPGLPDDITETALEVAGEGSTYERALALQDFFTGGDFAYSLDAPVEDGFDGTGIGVISRFLQERTGYCVHFASAMTVMARVLDIPARVVVGFQPGERRLVGGRATYTVSSSDLHAWPELYFEGIGWLRFEPTPGRGAPPGYSSIDAVDDPETPEFEGRNPSVQPETAPTTGPQNPVEEPEPEATQAPVEIVRRDVTPVVLAVVLGLLALLLTPAAARAVVRERRMRRVRHEGDADAAWAEIRDTARDHDWIAPETETPRQLGARLALVVGDDAVGRLRGGVETAAYDRPGRHAMTPEDVVALRRAIASAATLRVRLVATFVPPSLVARLGFGRDAAVD